MKKWLVGCSIIVAVPMMAFWLLILFIALLGAVVPGTGSVTPHGAFVLVMSLIVFGGITLVIPLTAFLRSKAFLVIVATIAEPGGIRLRSQTLAARTAETLPRRPPYRRESKGETCPRNSPVVYHRPTAMSRCLPNQVAS